MGVKSTVDLTRAEAEEKYVDLKLRDPEFLRKLRAEAVLLSNKELEDRLEAMNDADKGGEGFENYIVHGHG